MKRILMTVVLGMALTQTIGTSRAEVIEEILAWVNDDIITSSAYETREQELLERLYSQLSGTELDRILSERRMVLLSDMISEKLLLHQAERLYDLKRMEESLIKSFREQEKIGSDVDLEALVATEGMTVAELRRRLVEFNAPRSVLQYEVRDRVSVSDAEVEEYYRDRGDELASPEEATFREIVFLSEGRGMEVAMRLARETVEEIRNGADMDTLARNRSEAASAERGGLLGPFGRGELNPDIEDLVFEATVEEVSEPVETPYGAHVIRVEERKDPVTPDLESVRDHITKTLSDERFNEMMEDYLEKLWADAAVEVAIPHLGKLHPQFIELVKERSGSGKAP